MPRITRECQGHMTIQDHMSGQGLRWRTPQLSILFWNGVPMGAGGTEWSVNWRTAKTKQKQGHLTMVAAMVNCPTGITDIPRDIR